MNVSVIIFYIAVVVFIMFQAARLVKMSEGIRKRSTALVMLYLTAWAILMFMISTIIYKVVTTI